MELTDIQRMYLHTVFAYFHEQGKWPTYGSVERKIIQTHRDFDMRSVSSSMPVGFASSFAFNMNRGDKAVLTVPAVYMCPDSEGDLADFVRAVSFFVDKYFSPEEFKPEVTSEEIREKLLLSDLSIRKVGQLILAEGTFFSSFGQRDNDGDNWVCYLREGMEGIARFDNVHSIEEYLEKRDPPPRMVSFPEIGTGSTVPAIITPNVEMGVQANSLSQKGVTAMSNPAARTKAFISYSHKDKKYLQELHDHLRPFEREGTVDFWDDTRLRGGEDWREEIKKAMKEARVAILLVSRHFLASDFIAKDELPPLLEAAEKEGAVILPVVIGPCLFEESKIFKFQAFNPPSKPLNVMSPNKRDEVWVRVARRVREVLETNPNNQGTPDAPTPNADQKQTDDDLARVILEAFRTITYGPPLGANAKKLLHYLVLRIGLYSNNPTPSSIIAHELGLNPTEFNDAVEELKRKRCVRIQEREAYEEYISSYVEPEPLAWYYVDIEALGFDVRKDMFAVAQSVVEHEKQVKPEVIQQDTELSPDRINIAALILDKQRKLRLLMPGVRNGEFYFAEADATYDTRELVKKTTV